MMIWLLFESEIAKRFNLHADTLERWIRQGRIPVKKAGDQGASIQKIHGYADSRRRTGFWIQ